MTFLLELKRDYKDTLAAYIYAEKKGDEEAMQKLSHDLVRIADAMEREQ
jgi:membrane protein required for beta-lactamase induction